LYRAKAVLWRFSGWDNISSAYLTSTWEIGRRLDSLSKIIMTAPADDFKRKKPLSIGKSALLYGS
jgi:hypothetical protein